MRAPIEVIARLFVSILRRQRQPLDHFHACHFQLARASARGLDQGAILLAQILEEQPAFEQVPYAQEDFDEVEGLGDEVLGAAGQGALSRVPGPISGDHQHWQPVLVDLRCQHFQHPEPVNPRHVQVGDDEVRWC